MLIRFVVSVTFSGVTVFNIPLYAANPHDESNAGIIPKARHLKYGIAKAMTLDPFGITIANICSGNTINVSEKIPPRTLQRKMLCV
jgi:hypothetical protein